MSTLTTVAQWTTAREGLQEMAGRFAALLRAAGPDIRRIAVGEWTVADTAAHVALVVDADTYVATGEGPPAVTESFDGAGSVRNAEIARMNERMLALEPERDVVVLAERIDAGVEHLLDVTASADGASPVRWLAGIELTHTGLLAHLLEELYLHGFDIARASGQHWRVPPAYAALAFETVLVAVIRNAPRSMLARPNGARGPEFACEFRVGDAAPVVFASDGSGLVVEEPGNRKIDVRVSGDAAALALVSFNRISPLGPVLRGKIRAFGPRPWRLRHVMRMTP